MHAPFIVSQAIILSAIRNSEGVSTPASSVLPLVVDLGIRVVGAVGLIFGAVKWAVRRRDPLGEAPERPSQLYFEHLLIAISAYLIASLIGDSVVQFVWAEWTRQRQQLVAGLGGQVVGIAACWLVIDRQFLGGGWEQVTGGGKAFLRRMLRAGGVAVLAMGACDLVMMGTLNSLRVLFPERTFEPHQTLQLLREPGQATWMIVLLWLSAVLLAPVMEELFFRGIVQTWLRSVTNRRWVPIFLTASFFGLVHFSQPETIPAIVLLAVILGYMYERTGVLAPVIFIHVLFNLRTMLWEAFGAHEV